jgi:hypothetical protein
MIIERAFWYIDQHDFVSLSSFSFHIYTIYISVVYFIFLA